MASEDAQARLHGLVNFGAVRQPVPEAYQAAVKALVPRAKIQQYALRFDLELMVSAMCCVAETALEHFREKLIALFPKARVIADVNDMRDDETACVMIAPVKNAERVREKIKEAASEHAGDPNMWPFIQLIGDLLRASVILGDFDAFADAWSTLSDGFDLQDGHGRLKNNLWTDAERPPDMLVNVVVEPPGDIPPIVGEVQLHLREILVLKESSLHRMYEIVRASSIDALLAESERARRKSLVPAVRAPPRAELAARAEVVPEVELVPAHGERKEDDAAGCGLLCGGAPPLVGVVSVEWGEGSIGGGVILGLHDGRARPARLRGEGTGKGGRS